MSSELTRISRRHNSHKAGVAFAFVIGIALLTLPVMNHVNAAPAPVVDATAQAREVQSRLQRLENRFDNLGVVDLMRRLDTLQQEIQKLVGNLEVQMHQLKSVQENQRKTYVDLDTRIRKLEEALAGGSGVAPTSGLQNNGQFNPVPVTPANAAGSQSVPISPVNAPLPSAPAKPMGSELDQQIARSAYERAFNLLKQQRYDMAIASFSAFLEAYPDANYADNAQYWLGEANYAKRRYPEALEEFQKLVDNYPSSPKRADAMLKMGYTYNELGKKDLAKKTLNTIISSYPGSTAARLAQKRLLDIKATN